MKTLQNQILKRKFIKKIYKIKIYKKLSIQRGKSNEIQIFQKYILYPELIRFFLKQLSSQIENPFKYLFPLLEIDWKKCTQFPAKIGNILKFTFPFLKIH